MSVVGIGRSQYHLRPAYRFYQWVWTGLDWLYPPQCGGCSQPGIRWCQTCQDSTRVVSPPVCQCCGNEQASPGTCLTCQESAPVYTALRSWAVFEGPLRNALHRLKYRGDVALGEILARHLLEKLKGLDWVLDLVTPVPLGIARQEQRGYNQSALLALPLALGCGIAYRPRALVKVRETPSQVGLSSEERVQNVAAAFQSRSRIVTGKRVLVVDDVTTSGATLNACADALKEAGASKVYALTLARAA